MKYRIGTLEEYLIENPKSQNESDNGQPKKWKNPKKDNEYLWPSNKGLIEENEKFNIISIWLRAIVKPSSIKYYINKNGNYSAGIVEIGQVMDTGLKNLEIFDDKEEWINKTNSLKIKTSDI